jgi:hypothetical protein
MTTALNALSLVQNYGGVTVRRIGNQTDSLFAYGFTYHIEFDSVTTAMFSKGPLTLDVYCYGRFCPGGGTCSQTEVLFPPRHSHYCQRHQNYSLTNADTCVIDPTRSMKRLSTLSYFNITGASGVLKLTNSRHRLPPIIPSATLSISSNGVGIVAADVIAWKEYIGSENSMLVMTGTSWLSWEASYLLYAPSWTILRSYSNELLHVPTTQVSLSSLVVKDSSSFMTASPLAQFTVTDCAWNGGVIGGLGTVRIMKSLAIHDRSNKYLSYGMQLILDAQASANWTTGDLYLGNGANISVLGNWAISNQQLSSSSATSVPITIYQSPMTEVAANPLAGTQGRSFGSYYSGQITNPELQSGWYLNPLCGIYCLTYSQMTFTGKGILQVVRSSNIRFYLPLNMISQSRIDVGLNAIIALNDGGILGNDVIVNLSPGASILLTGGSLNMEATCTITGAGDLVVNAGEHNLAFSINANIKITNVRFSKTIVFFS